MQTEFVRDDEAEATDSGPGGFAAWIASSPWPALEIDGRGDIVRANDAAAIRFAGYVERLTQVPLQSLVVDTNRFATLLELVADGRQAAAEVEMVGDERSATISQLTLTPTLPGTRHGGAFVEIREVVRRRRSGAATRVRRPTRALTFPGRPQPLRDVSRSILERGTRLLRLEAGALYVLEPAGIIDAVGPAIPIDRLIDACRDEVIRPDAASLCVGHPIVAFGATVGAVAFAGARRDFGAPERDVLSLIAALAGLAFESDTARRHVVETASSDDVTHLPNRAALLDELGADIEQARERGERFAVMLIGLDHFKSINATVGQDAGDAVLWEVGNRLVSRVRAGDVVARLGSDEFALLIGGNPTRTEAAVVAERIRVTVSSLVRERGQTLTASIGVAMFPEDGRESRGLLKGAEAAMDAAKARGRNRWEFYSDTAHGARLANLRLLSELREAIAKGQLEMYYQPQHDTYSGDLFAVEALVRWNHPKRGLLTPGAFIPQAEQGDEIVAIGDFVRRTVCRDIARLRASVAPDLRVSMNLSARDFREPDLAERLVEAAEDGLVLPSALELEITETIAMGDAALTTRVLDQLHELGFVLALDDFGTGYSSLNYLRSFPVHALKIDRSFITDLPVDQGCMTIVKAVIAMAHALGMEVVAEGVETAEQLRFLRVEQCDRWQGYLYAPALRFDELEAYIVHGPYWARPSFSLSADGEPSSPERPPPILNPSRTSML